MSDATDTAGNYVAGPPDSPAIVFVHALGWTWRMWEPQLAALAPDFRVVAFDLPGHGRRADVHFRLDAAVETLDDAVRTQTSAPPIITGLSLGGFVAMAYASRYPERVAGLVLAGSSVHFTRRLRLLTRATADVFALLHLALGRRWLDYLTRRQHSAVRRGLPSALAEAQSKAGFYYRDFGRAILAVAASDLGAPLRDFLGPILILNGALDRFNVTGAPILATRCVAAYTQTIAGAAHVCNLDAPEAFTHAVRDFAGRVQRRTGLHAGPPQSEPRSGPTPPP
jgi:pimeloyl-ACP methyl ester carboxylesterase